MVFVIYRTFTKFKLLLEEKNDDQSEKHECRKDLQKIKKIVIHYITSVCPD